MSQRSSHDVGNPVRATDPLHSNRPSVWIPYEAGDCVRPKCNWVMGRTFLSVMTPTLGGFLIREMKEMYQILILRLYYKNIS